MSIPFYREERNERINSTAWREFLSLLHFQSEQEVNEDNWVILKIRIPSMILINSFYFLKFHLPNYILLPPQETCSEKISPYSETFLYLGLLFSGWSSLFYSPCPVLSLSPTVSPGPHPLLTPAALVFCSSVITQLHSCFRNFSCAVPIS